MTSATPSSTTLLLQPWVMTSSTKSPRTSMVDQHGKKVKVRAERFIDYFLKRCYKKNPKRPMTGQQTNKADTNKKRKIYVVGRQRACMDFVWNGYLTKNVRENMHSDWLIHLVHGYVKQSS